METKRDLRIRDAIRLALGAGFASALLATPVFAAEEDAAELERVQVTGSRILRTDLETASPIIVIGRQDIEASGIATAGEFMQRLPVIAGAPTNTQVNNGGGAGGATIELRGIGSARTLILVDGRRFITNDVNQIPMTIIERVEVLKDGASAIYGSDAIAGVVNFITRKDFEGVQASIQSGTTSEDDGHQNIVEMIAGLTGDRGNIVFGMNYLKLDQVNAGDRDWPGASSDVGIFDGEQYEGGSPTPPWGSIQGVSLAEWTALGGEIDGNCAASGNLVLTLRRNADGTPIGDGSDVDHYRCFIRDGAGNDSFNYQPDNVIQTPVEKKSFFVHGNVDLTDDIQYFGAATFTNNESNTQIAPLPQGFFVASGSNPYLPFSGALDVTGDGVADGAVVAIRSRATGNRQAFFDITDMEMVNGLRGSFGNWYWDAHYSWSEEKATTTQRGYIYSPALTAAVDDTANPFNVLWLGQVVLPANQGQQDLLDGVLASANPILKSTQVTHQQIIEANITGDLFELPAGYLAAAFGVHHRWTDTDFVPDYLTLLPADGGSCQVAAEACTSPLAGEVEVDELYAEFSIPVIDMLDLNIGLRSSDYSTFGRTTNGKITAAFRPMDSLLIRSTFAEVFRAPTISDLFSGLTSSADTFTDPCNGATPADSPFFAQACEGVPTDGSFATNFDQLNSFKGGNPNLQPETGETLTLGAVWSPDFITGFSAYIDYYTIELEDTLSVVGTQNILEQCFNSGIFCDRISRGPGGDWIQGLSSILDVQSNLGTLEAEGVDMGFQYAFAPTQYGQFNLNFDATYITEHNKQTLPTDPTTIVQNAGNFIENTNGGDGNYPRWRALTTLNWVLGNWSATWTMQYLHNVGEKWAQADECLADAGADPIACPNTFQLFGTERKIDAYMYHDVQVAYFVDMLNTTFAFGVNNLTNEDPPLMYTGFNADTDVRTYDTLGQFMYLRATVNFGN